MSRSAWFWWVNQYQQAKAPHAPYLPRPSPRRHEAYPEASTFAPENTLSANGYSLTTVSSPKEAQPYADAWQRLADTALEPNLFFEPWMLLPALGVFGAPHVEIALITREYGDETRIVGVFPIEHVWRFRGMPIHAACIWQHPHCYLGTPLIAKDSADMCWRVLFNWFAQSRRREYFLELQTLGGSGPVAVSLLDYLRHRHFLPHFEGMFGRPMMVLGENADTYLSASTNSSHRREYGRKLRRLDQLGIIRTLYLGNDTPLEPLVEKFLTLEASGWKGTEKTAMACSNQDSLFFIETVREAYRRGRLLLAIMELDGQPIAAQIAMFSQDQGFFLKTAYQEEFARYSPGVLLEVELIKYLHEERSVRRIDSCAAVDGAQTLRRLWHEHQSIIGLVCPTGRFGSELLTSLIPLARHLRRLTSKAAGRGSRPNPPLPPVDANAALPAGIE